MKSKNQKVYYSILAICYLEVRSAQVSASPGLVCAEEMDGGFGLVPKELCCSRCSCGRLACCLAVPPLPHGPRTRATSFARPCVPFLALKHDPSEDRCHF